MRRQKRIPQKVRDQLHERAQGCCERCGVWGATNAHHRLNQSQGRLHTLSNLMLLCGSGTTGCHGFVTTHPMVALSCGWTVPGGGVPGDVPVLRFDLNAERQFDVRLDDDGGIHPVEENAA
jgi:hypothetical protein